MHFHPLARLTFAFPSMPNALATLTAALYRGGLDIDIGQHGKATTAPHDSPVSISAPAVPSQVASFGKCYIDFASHADARRAFECLMGCEVVMDEDAVRPPALRHRHFSVVFEFVEFEGFTLLSVPLLCFAFLLVACS